MTTRHRTLADRQLSDYVIEAARTPLNSEHVNGNGHHNGNGRQNGHGPILDLDDLQRPSRPVESWMPSVLLKIGHSKAQYDALNDLVKRFETTFKDNIEGNREFYLKSKVPYSIEKRAISELTNADYLSGLLVAVGGKNTHYRLSSLGEKRAESLEPWARKIKAALHHVVDQYRALYQFEH
jgi:hypothetical protein